jgi:hypothetical protein
LEYKILSVAKAAIRAIFSGFSSSTVTVAVFQVICCSAHQRKADGTFMAQVRKYCQLPPPRNGPYARDCNLGLTAVKAAHHREKIQKT